MDLEKSYVGNIWHALTKAVEEAGEDANKDVVGADAKTRWFKAARTGRCKHIFSLLGHVWWFALDMRTRWFTSPDNASS